MTQDNLFPAVMLIFAVFLLFFLRDEIIFAFFLKKKSHKLINFMQKVPANCRTPTLLE